MLLADKTISCLVGGGSGAVCKELGIYHGLPMVDQDVDDVGENVWISFQDFFNGIGA